MRAPLPVYGPDGPWQSVRETLAVTGTVLVYGRRAAWLPEHRDPVRLRRMLGRDWDRYESMTHPVLRDRFVASRLLLRATAAAAIDTRPELVDLAYQAGGRPFVRGCDQIDVSLSHTEEMLVVGITRRGRVGVDVERGDRQMAGTGSESQTCTGYERGAMAELTGTARNDRLVRLWTLKEAYSKALGQGLRFRFTEFGFALTEHGARLVRPDGSSAGAEEDWSFGTFPLGRYLVSAAVHDAGFGGAGDLSVGTALDEGLLDTLLGPAPAAAPAPAAP
ncbi:4'-phosphopantetheinyl transferase family protein, partial [Streptomyces sparsus]